jgi:hypothetical protein
MSPSSIQLSRPYYAKVTPISLCSKNLLNFVSYRNYLYVFCSFFFDSILIYFIIALLFITNNYTMLFKVLKHAKNNDPQRPSEPVVYIVEEAELLHFLHENLKPSSGNVLVFDSFPEENLYLLSNDKD